MEGMLKSVSEKSLNLTTDGLSLHLDVVSDIWNREKLWNQMCKTRWKEAQACGVDQNVYWVGQLELPLIWAKTLTVAETTYVEPRKLASNGALRK